MSRNGSGVYSLPAGNPVTTGTTISSTWANNTLSDMATALTASIAYDGQTTPVANLPMGGNVHTNVGNASARTNYASAADVQDGTLTYLTGVSGTDTITAIGPVGMTSYATGQTLRFVAAGNTVNAGSFVIGQAYVILTVGTTDFTLIGASSNTVGVAFVATGVGTGTGTAKGGNISTSVTLNVNSIGAKAITKINGSPLAIGDIPSGAAVNVTYDGTKFQIQSSVGVTSFSAGATGLTPVAATNGAVTLAGVLGKLNGGTGALTATITQVARATNVSTITTSGTHGFVTGDYVTVAAVTNTGFNGNFTITGTPTSSSFTYAQVASTVIATPDTGTVTDLSYCNLATNVTGTLYPNFGGTGLATVPTGSLLVGNATSSMTSVAPTSNYQKLVVTPGTATSMGSLIPGASYTITVLGTGNWGGIGVSGTPAVGSAFVCNTTAQTGTGTATLNTWATGSSVAQATSISPTTATTVEFTNLPSWVKRVTFVIQNLSSNGTSQYLVQLGTGATPTWTTSGYTGLVSNQAGTQVTWNTAGCQLVNTASASDSWTGRLTISNLTGNIWVFDSLMVRTSSNAANYTGGYVSLGGTLTAVRLNTITGTDQFDAGTINILYE